MTIKCAVQTLWRRVPSVRLAFDAALRGRWRAPASVDATTTTCVFDVAQSAYVPHDAQQRALIALMYDRSATVCALMTTCRADQRVAWRLACVRAPDYVLQAVAGDIAQPLDDKYDNDDDGAADDDDDCDASVSAWLTRFALRHADLAATCTLVRARCRECGDRARAHAVPVVCRCLVLQRLSVRAPTSAAATALSSALCASLRTALNSGRTVALELMAFFMQVAWFACIVSLCS
jgi:hypothetical protein